MQPVDFTTLMAVSSDLRKYWLPARCEQVYQRDPYTLFIALRTLESRGWLAISWHPQAARLHIAEPPPKRNDTFTFSQQLKHQLGGLALTQINSIAPWERVLDLQFARRPDEPALWHLYVEVMGKYSNVILTTADRQIVTAAHQVSEQQSSLRPIQTGRMYVSPPSIRGKLPDLAEPFQDWCDRVSLIPGPLQKMLVKTHSGVSSAIAGQLILAANLPADILTSDLSLAAWQTLFQQWQSWLEKLASTSFTPGWLDRHYGGYTVLGIGMAKPAENVQTLLDDYYRHQFNQEEFRRLYNRLEQRLKTLLAKLRQKADTFTTRLRQSDEAESYRQKADLLMAHLHQWKVGMTQIELTDFESGEPVVLPLNPEKNAVQNAQMLYKQHQKLKRARAAVAPLLTAVNNEISYLEQVEDSLLQVPAYQVEADLRSLEESRSELIAQGYLRDTTGYQAGSSIANRNQLASVQKASGRSKETESSETSFRKYTTPQGFDLLVGRNNNQNEQLTFKQASDYDLWFHAQEIPGSHVLLRLNAGDDPSDETLNLAASMAAYYSRARQSEQVPVVYTEPKHVYKPNGALPGMVIYKRERVIWGQPQQAQAFIDRL
ncbi:MAG: putative RNA-binding protein homologous to eukaryotic snRNP [Phormidesmis priestleyi Ana]|uniref:Rqc2 homolog RqcH n=1 Tax=Phormidesmis priestleyi Ana TaxID=1666911 RepID=A0A0P7YVE0_9CYAN|nr:MAG: putative RNA-binding protein homologous to eukaryotic snRNP [Phormidesmis priestleyi Ana]